MVLTLDLLQQCRRGNRKAQFELYQQYYGQIRSVCARYNHSGQELSALVNEAFFKILTGLDSYQVDIPFEHWAKKVAIHVVIDDHRKNKNYRKLTVVKESEKLQEHQSDIDWNLAELEIDREEIEQMLMELPEMYRRIFSLFAIDGFAHREIAVMMEISEGTSKWYVSEARSMLKEKIVNRLKKNELNRGFKAAK